MEKLYSDLEKQFDKDFSALTPYPKASDRKAWIKLDKEIIDKLISMGENYLGYEFPQIMAADFMSFKRTGNRSDSEDKRVAKRKALDALVLAECAEYKGRFIDDIINGIYAICLEPAWQLPAHNSYIRNTPQLILPDVTEPVIELFSCEAGAILATAYYLLKDELDKVSPFICKLICDQVDTRVIKPYLTKHFWWMGKGSEPMCNWTIWCTQNTLLAAFLLPHSDSVRRKVLHKAAMSTDYFLKDYGEDGCCDEGAQYYRHAGLCLYLTTQIMCEVTGGHFAPLWKNKKIQNIAMYIANVHVCGKYYINFADCSPVAGRAGVREYLFGKNCGLKELTLFAASDYSKTENILQPEENNMYYRLMEIFTRKEILSKVPSGALPKKDIYYPSVGICIWHGNPLTVAVKSGDNDDSHNHNDTGSITVYKNGEPLLIDIGVESYTAKTFSSHRYEIWTMQSDYHNLPTINGCMQQDGASYAAKVISCDMGKGNSVKSFVQDIAGAYPKEAKIKKYLRTTKFSSDSLLLTDEWDKKAEVIQNFMTYEKPEIIKDKQGNTKISIGKIGSLSIDNSIAYDTDYSIEIEEHPITDKRLATCWKHSIYRIRIAYKKHVNKSVITVN